MDDLAAELDRFQRRYGTFDGGPAVERLRIAKRVQEQRLHNIDAQLDQLLALRATTWESIESLSRNERALLSDILATERRLHPEGWSPTPVLGFRAWRIDGGHFSGAVKAWTAIEKEAVCLDGAGTDEVPHTDGRCGTPACGLYALKKVEDVLKVTGWAGAAVAIGLVAMSGKVVEHSVGYRAQRMRIVALAIPRVDHVVRAASEPAIVALMEGCQTAGETFTTAHSTEAAYQWLTQQKEVHEAWTSESKIA